MRSSATAWRRSTRRRTGGAWGSIGMIEDVMRRVRAVRARHTNFGPLKARDHGQLARTISVLEGAGGSEQPREAIRARIARVKPKAPVIGITGTGGAGKSSLTDELLQRFVRHFPGRQIAVVAMDPTRRRSGGALLGDRIRMNSLAAESIFMRSLATRRQHLATSAVLKDVIDLYQLAGFDLDHRRDCGHRPVATPRSWSSSTCRSMS